MPSTAIHTTERRPGSGVDRPAPRSRAKDGGGPSGAAGQAHNVVPEDFPVSAIPAVNVACVPQRSPLRYPGGKTWLIPHVRAWLGARPLRDALFEPFCGGGIVSLTAAMERLCERAVMVELDRDVAAFWRAALRHTDELCQRIRDFDPSRENVRGIEHGSLDSPVDHGFRTLVLNRTRRGGILVEGASLIRSGENGKGVASRWYAETIVKRLRDIEAQGSRISFYERDGLELLESMARTDGVAVFVDPPYTAGGKRAGQRLYAHHEVDHARIFEILADSDLDFLMTYDPAPEIVALVRKHRFHAVTVAMKNTHHTRMRELVITRREMFREEPGQ